MPDRADERPDVEIAAEAAADELRFDGAPETRTRFPGRGARASGQATTRRNVDSPAQPGRTYRRVFAATRISSRLVDDGARRRPGEADDESV